MLNTFLIYIFLLCTLSCSNDSRSNTKKSESISSMHLGDSEANNVQDKSLKVSSTSYLNTIDSINIISLEKKYTTKNGDIYETKCKKWSLNKEELRIIIKGSKLITSEEKQFLYYYLPCEMQGQLTLNGVAFNFRANAASYIVLSNSDTTLYFGCEGKKYEKYFLLKPGNE